VVFRKDQGGLFLAFLDDEVAILAIAQFLNDFFGSNGD
jgi:hypothetical protein